jgi:hypothetical protein
MPVAFIFRVRANHEYPMLLCLLVALTGLAWLAERRPFALGALAVAAGLVGGLLIKGVFVVLILIAIVVWIVLNPPATPGVRAKYVAATLAGIVAMIAAAVAYDALYVRATGETFWAAYWQRQLGPLTIVTPIEGAVTLAGHLLFYLSRVIWHPAPWSAALIIGAWRSRRRLRDWFRATSDPARRGLQFVIVFASLAILVLSPSSRFAERYAFSATFAVACAGVVASLSLWPRLQSAIGAADRRIPCFPAVLWLLLFVLRLGVGPLLPRVD